MYKTGAFLFGAALLAVLSMGQANAAPVHAADSPSIGLADSNMSMLLAANDRDDRLQHREPQHRGNEPRAHQRDDRRNQDRMNRDHPKQDRQMRSGHRPEDQRRDHRDAPRRDNRGKGPHENDKDRHHPGPDQHGPRR